MNLYNHFPVFRSLMEPQLMFGLPRRFGAALATVTLVVVWNAGQWWFLPVMILIAYASSRAAKQDPYFFDVTMELLRLPKELD